MASPFWAKRFRVTLHFTRKAPLSPGAEAAGGAAAVEAAAVGVEVDTAIGTEQ